MKKLLLFLVVGILVLGGTGVLASSQGAQFVKRAINLQGPEEASEFGAASQSPPDPGLGPPQASQQCQFKFDVKPDDPKAKDPDVVRAKALIQLTLLLGETKQKVLDPFSERLKRDKQKASAVH